MTEKCKLTVCKNIWMGEINTLHERINGVQTLQASIEKELERRMHDANDIKKDFGKVLVDMDKKLEKLEARYGFGISVVVVGFTIFQVMLQVVFHLYIKGGAP